uniref:ubiquitinyl hydrolase 1 n=1 Tax=Heterorhabditis bacteriophora TaxID=37862 RepID=A0A1I7WQJ6_HETBA
MGHIIRYRNNTINQSVMVQFKNIIGDFGNDYRTSNQQDAQEFLIWLLDKVHEDLNTGTQRDTNYNVMESNFLQRNQSPDDALAERRLSHCSVITSLFEAQLRSSIRCCSCGYQKFIYDPYMFVSLQVPQE